MADDSLSVLYQWARAQLNSPFMPRYLLYKVNGQTPGKVSLLLRDIASSRANAEIEVEYTTHQDLPYHAIFSLLSFNVGYYRPIQLRPTFSSQQEVIHWIKTGQKRAI